ncbi:Ankyrin repeat-containing domain, partial [Trinorchestia longiramus]
GCLNLLMSPLCALDLNQMSRTTSCSLEELISWIHNQEIENFLTKHAGLKLPTNVSAASFQNVPPAGVIELILERDDRDRLEIEIAKCRNDFTAVFNVPESLGHQTIFHLAVRKSAADCLQYLLRNTTDLLKVNQPDENGTTPLHLAVQIVAERLTTSSVACLKLLLLHGAHVNARNNNGDSALHILVSKIDDIACQNQDDVLTCLECLLKMRSINTYARNNYGQTPQELLQDYFVNPSTSVEHVERLLQQKPALEVKRVTGRKILKEQVYENICDSLVVNP